RGEDEVALVFTVFVVDHDDRLTGGDVGDRALDGVEPRHFPGLQLSYPDDSCSASTVDLHSTTRQRAFCRRSTYLAITSTSRLTRVPGSAVPRVVSERVVGMSEISNHSCPRSPPRPDTVSETPSTVIEPFSTT